MAITALPTPPLPTDTTLDFNTKAFNLLNALPTFVTETNAVEVAVDADAVTATTQAGIATTKAGESLTSANTATTQAGVATTQAGIATTQAGLADAARIAAEAALDTFDDKYLGVKASDPTLDNDGNPLQDGAFYINSVSGYIRVYVNTTWVQGISGVAGVSSFNGLTGAVTGVDLNTAQTLTNKILEAVTLNNGYAEEVYTLTGTTPALSSSNGSIQTWTLTANSTPTDSLSTGQSIILGINDGTAYTVTWPSVLWTKSGGSGAAPTLNASSNTWVVLWKVGSSLYGSYLGDA